MEIIRSIQNRIYELRGERVLLDFDLAKLYGVETRVLNQAVKRNIERFPGDFMFQLTSIEFELLRSQIVTSSMSSQSVMTSKASGKKGGQWSEIVPNPGKRPKSAFPFASTEQGVAMLSGVLNSNKAIKMNIAIMRAFVEIRRIMLLQCDVKEQLRQIKEHINDHDTSFLLFMRLSKTF